MKLGIAVIGTGEFGQNHVKVLSQMPQTNLLYVCDLNLQKALSVAKTYSIPHVTKDVNEIWRDERVQAVVIATSENSHYPLTMEALEHGKHVLLEKPIALDVTQAEEMVTFAKKKGLILLPGHMLRYDASYYTIKQKLQSGAFGDIYTIYTRRNVPRSRFALHSRTHPVFMALTHDIDIVIWYVQSEVTRVFAMEKRTSSKFKNPDIFWGLVEFKNGVIAIFETQWTLPDQLGQYLDVRLEMMTSKGKVTMKYPGENLIYMMEGNLARPDVTLWPELFGITTGALRNELEYFVDAIKNPEKPVIIRGEEAVQGIQLAQLLIESAHLGQPVSLD